MHFHSFYIMSYIYAKFKENPCVGTDVRTPLNGIETYYQTSKQIRPIDKLMNDGKMYKA